MMMRRSYNTWRFLQIINTSSSIQRKHDDLFGGSSYWGPMLDPQKYGTHVPSTKDLEGQPTFIEFQATISMDAY